MNYQFYQVFSDMLTPARLCLEAGAALSRPWMDMHPGLRGLTAACEVMSCAQITHAPPGFGLDSIRVGRGRAAREVAVREEVVHTAPFGTLLHFRKEGVGAQPRVLIVAPMSGHFASRLRETVRTMLAENDVYITDWRNARDVPLAAGSFDLDDYAQYLIEFLERIGEGAHLLAVCQSCVGALVAAAIMAEDDNPAQPRSLTLLAGPVDPRINPTATRRFAMSAPIGWFERNFISAVPPGYAGVMRRVCPGFMQLAALMGMEPQRHLDAFMRMYLCLLRGERDEAEGTRAFYEEYLAMLDLTAEFYISTLQRMFREPALADGRFLWRGRRADPAAIRRTALLTVEGARDEVCAVGQTAAAHALCSGLPQRMRSHYEQAGADHSGVFSGTAWEKQIYPKIRGLIRSHDASG